MNEKGVTLIELIIFIIVGGMFIPLAYISFTALTSNLVRPETAAIIKAIAETKMNDINSAAYDSIVSSASYSNVTDDTRFQRSSPNPYDGYKWRWEVSYIAYKDNTSHNTTTMQAPDSWLSSSRYKAGDYVKPSNYPTNSNFYRVYFQERKPGNRYEINELVRPATANNNYYKSVQPPEWMVSFTYNIGDMVRPTVSNGHYYKCIKPPAWKRYTYYAMGTLVRPISENGYYYIATNYIASPISSSSEPTWSTTDCFWEVDWSNFHFIYWCPFTTMISGTDPNKIRNATATSQIVFDNYVTWQEDTTLTASSSAQPTLPFDGSVTWQAISNITSLTPGNSEPTWELSIPKWQRNTSYSIGNKIRPNVENNHYYVCAIAGTSGGTEPIWSTGDGATVNDGTVKWQEKSTISDNDVSWIRSGAQGGTPYKSVKIYITPPGCSNDSCAYVLTSVVAARDYATRP